MASTKKAIAAPPAPRPSALSQPAWSTVLAVLLALGVLVVLAIEFAQPVNDGDLYWQMAYGEYLVKQHTLVPDHAIYSFTPAANVEIYCAWIGEMLLHLLYGLAGLPILFAMRYVCVGMLVIVGALLARRLGQLRNPLVWGALLVGVLMSFAGALLKPEMFSLLLMSVTAGVYFFIKARPDEPRIAWALPPLMAVWVNTHGAAVFGLVFLGGVATGELLNAVLKRPEALPRRTLQHLVGAIAASFAAIFLNPYGATYPLYVARVMAHGNEVLKSVQAYQSIFDPGSGGSSLVQFGAVAAILVVGLALLSRTFDLGLVVVNLGLAYLYVRFGRTTYFWAPVAAFTIIYLASKTPRLSRPSRQMVLGLSAAVVLGFAYTGKAMYWSVTCGTSKGEAFGTGGFNPVLETEFIRRFLPNETRVGNTYDIGGYMLWALYPRQKILIDPRYFPYRDWFPSYLRFQSGLDFQQFLERFPCNVFLVNYAKDPLIAAFMRSPEWKMAFWGPTAAVFVKRSIELPPDAATFAPNRLEDIRNLTTATLAYQFAMRIQDLPTGERILDHIRSRFTCEAHAPTIERLTTFHQGVTSVTTGQYERALAGLQTFPGPFLVNVRNWQTRKLAREGKYAAALVEAHYALSLEPQNLYALFNAGTLGWKLAESGPKSEDEGWRNDLEQFLELYGRSPGIPKNILKIAQDTLDGLYRGVPMVISVPEPTTFAEGRERNEAMAPKD